MMSHLSKLRQVKKNFILKLQNNSFSFQQYQEKQNKNLIEYVQNQIDFNDKSIRVMQEEEFREQMQRMMKMEKIREERLQNQESLYIEYQINSQIPIKSIIQSYLKQSKEFGFDQEQLIICLCQISKRIKMNKEYGLNLLDISGNDIKIDASFKEIIEEIKYSCKKGVYQNADQLARVCKHLMEIDFKDNKLIEIMIERVQEMLDKRMIDEEFKEREQYFQPHKELYYTDQNKVSALLREERFRVHLINYLSNNFYLQSYQRESKIQEENYQDNIAAQLYELHQMHDRSLKLLIDSILSIRYQYYKMYLYKNQFKDNDPDFYVQFQAIQETLYLNSIISLDELKLPYTIQNTSAEDVVYLITQFMDKYQIQFTNYDSLTQDKHIINKQNQIQHDLNELFRMNTEIDWIKLSVCIQSLSQLSNSLSKEVIGEDYIDTSYLKGVESEQVQDSSLTISHVMIKQFLMKNFEQIEQYFGNMPIINQLYLVNAYQLCELHEQSESLLKISNTKELLEGIENYNCEELHLLLSTYCSQTNRVLKLEKKFLECIEKCLWKFDSLMYFNTDLLMIIAIAHEYNQDFSLKSLMNSLAEKLRRNLERLNNFQSLTYDEIYHFLIVQVMLESNLIENELLTEQIKKISQPLPIDPTINKFKSILNSNKYQQLNRMHCSSRLNALVPDFFLNNCLIYITTCPNIKIIEQVRNRCIMQLHPNCSVKHLNYLDLLHVDSNHHSITYKHSQELHQVLMEWGFSKQVNLNIQKMLSLVPSFPSRFQSYLLNQLQSYIKLRDQNDHQIILTLKYYNFNKMRLILYHLDQLNFPSLSQIIRDELDILNQEQKSFGKVDTSLLHKNNWIGKRLTAETAINSGKVEDRVIKGSFLYDKRETEYPSWQKVLDQLDEDNRGVVQNESQKTMLKHQNFTITSLPFNPRTILQNIQFNINTNITTQKLNLAKDLKFIQSLNNMKHQIRKEFSLKQITNLVIDLDFIQDIAELYLQENINNNDDNNDKVAGQVVYRSIQEYIKNEQYLEKGEWVQDKLRNYFTMEAYNKEKINSLIQFKQNHFQRLFKKDPSQAKDFEAKMNRHLLKSLRINQNSDNLQNTFSFNSKKYFDVNYNLEKLFANTKAGEFTSQFDKNLLEEDEVDQLINKRIECEQNFVKMRILLKMENSVTLTEVEKKFYEIWKEKCEKNQEFKKIRSNIIIKDLSKKDKKILEQFRYSQFEKFKEYQVSDILLEMQNMFVLSFVKEKELEFKREYLLTHYNIDVKVFIDNQQDNLNLIQLRKHYEQLYYQSQSLSQSDIKLLVDIMTVNKDETSYDRANLNFNQQLLTQHLNIFNQNHNRLNLIELFIETRETEIVFQSIITIYFI